jgi:predicted RNA-binding Zn-ribbon protein involved in translation (DUF1610 family)
MYWRTLVGYPRVPSRRPGRFGVRAQTVRMSACQRERDHHNESIQPLCPKCSEVRRTDRSRHLKRQ